MENKTWSVLLALLILIALAGNASATPIITDVNTPQVDGSFTVGEVILIDVTYNELVGVDIIGGYGGIPSIAMNSGGFAVYDSGSGSDVLIPRRHVKKS